MFSSIVLFLLIQCSSADRSFTLVVDTTNSMKEDINIIQANMDQVVNSVTGNDFSNFVLVSFKETVMEPAFITESGQALLRRLKSLTTSGGMKCLENSLAGIEAALRVSEKQSVVFVFTDAYAKDLYNLLTVQNLCQESHSQVIIFLSGYCSTPLSSQGSNDVIFYNLAKACSGAVLTFDPVFDLRKGFRFMKEIVTVEWTDVTTHDKFTDFKTYYISVDAFTTNYMIVVSGEDPFVEVTSKFGNGVKLDTILQTKYALVVSFPQPMEVGEYTMSIRGRGMVSVTEYERNFVPFEFGFSTIRPRSIKETASQPMPGVLNYIVIHVHESIKLRTVEWLESGNSSKRIIYLTESEPGSYIGNIQVNPDKMFRFWIVGEDVETQHDLRGSSKLLSPQKLVSNTRNLAPEAEILDKKPIMVDYGSNLTLACRVAAYPKPNIQWKDDEGNYLTSEDAFLEIPYLYISYVTIPKVYKNSTVTCNAENNEGATFKRLDVFVNRTFSFDVVQIPEDVSVQYESAQYLYCKIDAYPEATITWYLNDTLINEYTNSRIDIEDGNLLIKKMGFEDVGLYECRATNDVETRMFPASVKIIGVETPEIRYKNTQISLKLGEFSTLECSIAKGNPEPEIEWKFKSSNENSFGDLPFGASVSFGKLQIESAQKNHAGVYRCVAANIIGEDELDFNLDIKFAPIIKDREKEVMLVKSGHEVCIPCEVEAMPEATVRWELMKGFTPEPLDEGHRTDEQHKHCFTAMSKDAGDYHCIAENDVGKAERVVSISVQEPPYIKAPKESAMIYAIVGANIELICNVLAGNPPPMINWEFKAEGSSAYIVINRGASTFTLPGISRYNQGEYVCVAKNIVGFDKISYKIVVI